MKQRGSYLPKSIGAHFSMVCTMLLSNLIVNFFPLSPKCFFDSIRNWGFVYVIEERSDTTVTTPNAESSRPCDWRAL